MGKLRVQLIFIALMLLGVIGLGVEIFAYGLDNMTVMYIFAGVALVGFVGNAIAAVSRVWKKLKK